MVDDVFARVRSAVKPVYEPRPLNAQDHAQIARAITLLENAAPGSSDAEQIRRALARARTRAPVIGITGSGGAGKSSLTDELLARLTRHFPDRRIAVVAMDPTRRRSGGALLGDRIRMNSLASEAIFMRSLATRRQHLAIRYECVPAPIWRTSTSVAKPSQSEVLLDTHSLSSTAALPIRL